jgi:predicted RecA/RadA family phage recombinase
MQNYVKPGNVLTLTAPYDVDSGDGALVDSIFGIATADVANGEEGEFQTVGVFDIAKRAGISFTQGEKVYWHAANKDVTDLDSAGTYLIGVATQAAAADDATARVRLNGTSVS